MAWCLDVDEVSFQKNRLKTEVEIYVWRRDIPNRFTLDMGWGKAQVTFIVTNKLTTCHINEGVVSIPLPSKL